MSRSSPRREFLKTLAAAGSAVPACLATSSADAANPSERADHPPLVVQARPIVLPPPAVDAQYTAQEHRRRLQNIAYVQQRVRRCLRKHLVTDYLPGQTCYNLGEYPCQKIWDPDDWDERELDRLHEHGIRLIHVHEEWNDVLRRYGSHKLDAANPAGFRRFVDMVHRRGMRLLVYVSSGYFPRNDPDFRPQWALPANRDLREIYFRYARCSPASPGWRAYFLPRVLKILDNYGVDGIYNDLGYSQPNTTDPRLHVDDAVAAFEESSSHDGALEDLLGLIYAEIKRRGGVVKIHRGGPRAPNTNVKVYDYLWVGEGGRAGDQLREASKNHPPYVISCLDMSRARIDSEDELYLHTIPYLQFPLLLSGRPFTGERASVPGIQYPPEPKCFWTRHLRAMGKHYHEHPEGPFSYGWWDSVPGRPEARPTHARWLKQYLPMVEEGTWAWLEVADTDLWASPLPEGIVASVFANRRLYLVLANYGQSPAHIHAADAWLPAADPQPKPSNTWRMEKRSLAIMTLPTTR